VEEGDRAKEGIGNERREGKKRERRES